MTTATDRSNAESVTWSLSWQAAVGRDFFANPLLAGRIRKRLLAAHRDWGRVLVDFVLLPTEIHAISRVSLDDSVESLARAFGNVLSRWVRQANPVRSPVLAGRYLAVMVDTDEALRHEVCMLAWRPVFKGLCGTPTHYPRGALRHALGLIAPEGFDTRPLLDVFGGGLAASRAALRAAIAKPPSVQEWRTWELTRGLELATGSAGPKPSPSRTVDGAAATLIAAGGGYGIDGALDLLATWVSARIQPAHPPDLQRGSGALAARGRALVACLAVTHGLCSAASVARHFCRAKATLSEQMTACRLNAVDRSTLATPLRRILDEAAMLRAREGRTDRSEGS